MVPIRQAAHAFDTGRPIGRLCNTEQQFEPAALGGGHDSVELAPGDAAVGALMVFPVYLLAYPAEPGAAHQLERAVAVGIIQCRVDTELDPVERRKLGCLRRERPAVDFLGMAQAMFVAQPPELNGEAGSGQLGMPLEPLALEILHPALRTELAGFLELLRDRASKNREPAVGFPERPKRSGRRGDVMAGNGIPKRSGLLPGRAERRFVASGERQFVAQQPPEHLGIAAGVDMFFEHGALKILYTQVFAALRAPLQKRGGQRIADRTQHVGR